MFLFLKITSFLFLVITATLHSVKLFKGMLSAALNMVIHYTAVVMEAKAEVNMW
jgi:ABC-type thiamin/hydroxymethylpyrimidine transport system permease subunit